MQLILLDLHAIAIHFISIYVIAYPRYPAPPAPRAIVHR